MQPWGTRALFCVIPITRRMEMLLSLALSCFSFTCLLCVMYSPTSSLASSPRSQSVCFLQVLTHRTHPVPGLSRKWHGVLWTWRPASTPPLLPPSSPSLQAPSHHPLPR
ncbi:hypothetical protein QBC42DRAFT_36539 [Cladorrhinum samala]|uniref:Secreted protein n=1 Tax=Cladorrhinum samala TaxID=585594 RepID=A0AAV9HZ38_9PEZI|nr:hypothetical protein QBC42DRAFT_36539 [Cladorrhinum samala]